MGVISAGTEGSGDEPLAAINVTSLVDVMFCLLIIFMVGSPMNQPQKFKKAKEMKTIPKANGQQITPEQFEFSVITVDATGQVFVGSTPLSADIQSMQSELAGNEALKQHGMAFVQGDQTVSFEKIVDVLVGLKEAGIEEVGFISKPQSNRS